MKQKIKRRKYTPKKLNIRLSWLTKISHGDFITQTDTTLTMLEMKLKKQSFIPNVAFDEARKLIDQMSELKPTQRPHNLTEVINQLHTERKKQLTAIRQYIKIIEMDTIGAFNKEQQRAANKLFHWLQNIYGTRHYDLGIRSLSFKISYMFDKMDKDEELKEIFKLCSRFDSLEQLRNTNIELEKAFLQRDVEMAERDLSPTFKELRGKIYIALTSLVRMVNDMIRMEAINEKYIEAKRTIYHYLNPKRANWLQQATKRRLRRERAKLEDDKSSIDWVQSLAYGYM